MEFQPPAINFLPILPVVIVVGWGLLLMVIDLVLPDDKKGWAAWVSAIGLVLALVQSVALWGWSGGTFVSRGDPAMIILDNYATFLNVTFLLTALLTVLMSGSYLRRMGLDRPEYYMLLLISTGGMMLMGMANDLILIFMALELLSIPLYIMSGMARPKEDSEESAMKYFFLGAFSSAILVFGIALIYGATGSTLLPEILAGVSTADSILLGGIAFLLVGFGFKVAAAPFHMWTPDVYQGAPTIVTAFMSVGAKVAGFAAMLRVFVMALPDVGDVWVPAVAALAALTMVVGNVVAIVQDDIKRMLAYSSIAHAGYIMIAVAATMGSENGVGAALFYMFAYLFTNLGAFAIVLILERDWNKGTLLDDYKGLAKHSPLLALAMAFFMLSLTGIPTTGGFAAKFYVFRAAIEADLLWLTLVGIVTSVVSAFYYLRVVYLMYMFEGEVQLFKSRGVLAVVGITAVATLILGIFPGPGFELASEAVMHGMRTVLAGG
jgi:NADH-quinone oxidoreductase subunit N